MSRVMYLSLIVLFVVLGTSLRTRAEGRSLWFKYIFIFSIVAVFAFNFYFSYQQYQIWSKNDISKYLIPPHQSVNYFLFYAFTRFFAPYLISLLAAVAFFFSAKILNKKYEERFFEPEEYYLGASALFLVSHPGWLFYAAILLSVYFLFSICYLLFSRRQERLPLYHLWIPAAIFVILIQSWLQDFSLWQLLKF